MQQGKYMKYSTRYGVKNTNWYRFVPLVFLFLLCGLLLVGCTVNVAFPPGAAPSPTETHPTAQEQQIAQAVFDAINKDRAAAGLPPLHWSAALARSAHQHNLAMMAANQLAHQLSREPGLGEREKQQGVSWVQAAENIGVTNEMNESGALALHQAMMAEKPPNDGHRQNILNAQNNQLGVDVLFDSVHGELWLTEDFAEVL